MKIMGSKYQAIEKHLRIIFSYLMVLSSKSFLSFLTDLFPLCTLLGMSSAVPVRLAGAFVLEIAAHVL